MHSQPLSLLKELAKSGMRLCKCKHNLLLLLNLIFTIKIMFKQYFKKYKCGNPSLAEIYDFNDESSIKNEEVKTILLHAKQDSGFYGMKAVSDWEVYEFQNGLVFIKNPFTSKGQRYWAIKSLKYYTRKPNKTNLDIHQLIPENEDWWETCQRYTDKNLLNKMRWTTLGYHHDWDSKVYSEESKNDFPDDLQHLSRFIANLLGYNNFNAEAAIVNFYHMNSTLSGHTDHSEKNLDAPLLSFSFGQTAIFLLGGKTIDEKPTAMLLHSGDIVIMSKNSRLCYHGVPKIISAGSEPWNELEKDSECNSDIFAVFDKDIIENYTKDSYWTPFREYLNKSRININVRQVV